MRLISYLDRLQQKSEGALTLIWSRYSEMTLPGQRAVLPPFYCPLSCVSVSIVCLYSRCAFWQIHTVPIKLPMSSTSDWETRCGDGWQQVCFFWGGGWLFGVAAHAFSTEYWTKWSNKTRNYAENQLYVKTVTSSPVLFRSTFPEMFCLWYNFVRSSHNALYSCKLSTDFSYHKSKNERLYVNVTEKQTCFIPLD